MKAAIMQPTYLSWAGYFDLMDQSDVFIFLDNVQFSRQSWHQRNKIKTPGGEVFLTIPIVRKHPQLLNEVEIDNTKNWQRKHLRSICCNYAKAKYFQQYIKFFENIYSRRASKLIDFNMPIALWLKQTLGIETRVLRASQLKAKGSNVELIVAICKELGVNEYLSPEGGHGYINQYIKEKGNNIFAKENITLKYHYYHSPKYTQLWNGYIPYLSVIDLLFNEGEKSLSIIKSGRENGTVQGTSRVCS